MINDSLEDGRLVLAAEEFPEDQFEKFHTFSDYEERIIRSLIAHGPVLLRGSRGSGKSALLKEAYLRINKSPISEKVIGIYISLRYLPLLRYEGYQYEEFFCNLLIKHINEMLRNRFDNKHYFSATPEVSSIQESLAKLSRQLERRIVLFFDDAAHIGREASLKEFFDIFRTLSSNATSCKAAIYPGVTEFGARFDLLNDASVIDLSRNEEMPYFTPFFVDIISKRYSEELNSETFAGSLSLESFAAFLGRAVTGNVRAFLYACNYLTESKIGQAVTLLDLENTLKYLAADYYWPLLEELEPKLGNYALLIEPTREITNVLFKIVGENVSKTDYGPSCLIHKRHVERLKKAFEMLEYLGIIAKREASRKLKSGGRGPRYVLNLSILMEELSRLTVDLFSQLVVSNKYSEIFKGEEFDAIKLPQPGETKELGILAKPIDILHKSKAYPYGLTYNKIDTLKGAGILTVGQLAETSDEEILNLDRISSGWLSRIKSLIGQAIWM